MTKPIVANNKPRIIDLENGKDYYFCTCGRSSKQPFCDGSQKGTSFTPQVFTAEKDGKAGLCACKQSGKLPFCDGSHREISDEEVGKAFG